MPDAQVVAVQAQAYSALRTFGFRETETKSALAEARSHVGPNATLEEVVRQALLVAANKPRAVA